MTCCTGKPLLVPEPKPPETRLRIGFRCHLPPRRGGYEQLRMSCKYTKVCFTCQPPREWELGKYGKYGDSAGKSGDSADQSRHTCQDNHSGKYGSGNGRERGEI